MASLYHGHPVWQPRQLSVLFRFTRDSEHLISIAVIAETTGRFLVALPVKAWDKVKAKRVLPQPVLERPVSASIAGCTAEDRLTPSEPTYSCVVWVGFFKRDFWSCVSFGSELQPTLDFEDSDSGDPCYPFAGGLVDLAVEKGFITPPVGAGDSQRLQSLEERFSMLEKGLQDLVSELHRDKGEGEFLTPGEETNPIPAPERAPRKSALRNAKSKAVAAPPGSAPQADLPGLDWCGCCCNSSGDSNGSTSCAFRCSDDEAHQVDRLSSSRRPSAGSGDPFRRRSSGG